jgi:ATP-dependent helicase/nuclease subunit A
MSGLPIPDKTRQDQLRASDPDASAWVSANAGSGKTYVLVQRMVRLMLRGVPPDCILALTYTKAAAANMATRVFDRLASWVGLDDEALTREIEVLEGERPDHADLARARRLFAQAIETPGGLKIQTIHAFCERLLQLFPFEANVAARFSVLDETTGGELLATARDTVLREAAGEHGTRLSLALGVVAGAATQDGLATLLGQAMTLRHRLSGPDAPQDAADRLAQSLRTALGLTAADTAETVRAEILYDGIPRSEWTAIAETLETGSDKDKERAASLREGAAHGDDDEALAAYREVFFTKDGERRKAVVTKAVQTAHPGLAERVDREKHRVDALLDKLRAVDCHERTAALLVLLEAIFAHYESEKSRRGALDFDDLIARTLALLQSHGAAFVLYKLDAGIEHVLIDEAQDTSREQWDILGGLTSEFFAGEGVPRRRRTIFAVGDPKQSIYSFQGAAPDAFAEARERFRALVDRLATAGGKPFAPVELQLSFRSVPSVLSAVDRVFADKARRAGLTFGDDAPPVHEALRQQSPGHVEIWEITRKADGEDPDAWARPVDEPDDGSAPVQLAGRIARMIRGWIRPGSPERIEDEDPRSRRPVLRPIRAGDVLILVRSRGPLFDGVIRALKDCGVPVAGADRLALASHIAVQDLLALGQASLTPDDDLTFAAVLKSPLVGLTDDDLLAFAPHRRGSLSRALREAAATAPRLAAAQDSMRRWRNLAGTRGPFAFYAAILGAEGGRRAMLRRLGPEAADALDEFLRLALEHEQRESPSLQLFLAAFARAEPVIKRDMEAGRDEVRVMTVHGAKGLEAPVVILPDSCGEPNGQGTGPNRRVLFDVTGPDGRAIPAWSQRKDDDPAPVRRARQDVARQAGEEYRRLLYVAMTRARDRLYVAGATQLKNPPAGCWYQLVREALGPELVEHRLGDDTVWRWDERRPEALVPAGEPQTASPDETLPGWLRRPAPPEPPAAPPLRPSSAVEAAEAEPRRQRGGPLPAEARAAGRLVHELLEVLPACPPHRRRAAAETLARARGAGLSVSRRLAVVDDVLALLARSDLAALFGPHSRAEVPVTGTLLLGRSGAPVPVSGQIDRLVVTADLIIVADFKTGEPPPAGTALPGAYVAQLAVYRALLAQAFPGRRIDCVLVWTAGPRADLVDPALLDATLAGIKPA